MTASALPTARAVLAAFAALLLAAAPGAVSAGEHDTSRIVSAGGSITEIIYALGEESHLVGVDSTSLHPAAALADNPNVGYLRQLAPEGILSLAPTLILAEGDAGPPTTLDVLTASGVPVVKFDTPWTPAGAIEKIRGVAKILEAEEKGEAIVAALESDLDAAARAAAAMPRKPRVLFVLSHQGDRLLAAGAQTAAAAMIDLAGGVNALSGFNGYKPVSAEAVLEADPEVVVTMRTGQHQLSADVLFANAALRDSRAAKAGRLVSIDGLYLLGFGPRLGKAMRELAEAIAPAVQ